MMSIRLFSRISAPKTISRVTVRSVSAVARAAVPRNITRLTAKHGHGCGCCSKRMMSTEGFDAPLERTLASATGQDQTLSCRDCNQSFVFTASEQAFFADKGFTIPNRCKPCRDMKKRARQAQGGFEGSRGFSSQRGGYDGGSSGGRFGSSTFASRPQGGRAGRQEDPDAF